LNFLERMRSTYKDRQEFRIDLIPILHLLQLIYEVIGKHKKVVEVGLEIFNVLGEPLKYYNINPTYLLICEAFKNLGRPDLAKKYALEQFEFVKTKKGTTMEVFRLKFPDYVEFLE